MQEKIYECICGQTFNKPNPFNSHKSRCKIHLEAKGYNFEEYLATRSANNRRSKEETLTKKKQAKEEAARLKWISEHHICEKCGILILEKFGSGKFCSRKCSNSHIKSEESKIKVSQTLKKRKQKASSTINKEIEYLKSPHQCEVCKKVLPYALRHRKSCPECYIALLSMRRKDRIAKDGYNLNVTVKSKYKYGTYANISCDSSWELAFILYCLDHNISIIRNRIDFFTYNAKGTEHKFYPDFKIEDTYIEIKGRRDETSDLKAQCIPEDVKFKILYKDDIKPYIDYAVNKYGENYIELYDRNYPSWMDKIN